MTWRTSALATGKAREEQVRPIEINRTDAAAIWHAMIDEALS